jgi:hypothetical protein
MCSRNWRIAMMVPWLAFVAMALEIWRAYDRLPAVIASHFNAAGVPNGFAPKDQVFLTILGLTFALLCLFTFILSRFPQISGLGWLVMVAEFWGVGLLLGITHGTLRVNLGEASVLSFPVGAWSLIMGAALVIGEAGRIRAMRNRSNASSGELIAEEVHNSVRLSTMFAGISVVMICSTNLLHMAGPARGILVTVGLILLGCAVWAYTGFIYRITTAGLEIRMLGFPIRFVPAMDITAMQAKDCNPLTDFGGWGIRGIGKMRAYIWGGNRCVYLQTHAGDEIYLGIRDADRMVRELESMAPVAHR